MANDSIDLLRWKFPGRAISRNGDVIWPPRSCYLTPLYYFLRSYVISQVYKNNPQSWSEGILEWGPRFSGNVIDNLNRREVVCRAAGGVFERNYQYLSDLMKERRSIWLCFYFVQRHFNYPHLYIGSRKLEWHVTSK